MRAPGRVNTAILFVVTAIISGNLTGCGDKTVSFNSGGITQTFSAGDSTDTKGFPVPMYPKAKPIGANEATGDPHDNSRFIMLSTKDPVDKVRDFYESTLKTQGWEVSESVKQPTLVNLAASKGEQEASVMISADVDGSTTISLALGKKTEGVPQVSGKEFTPDKLNPPTD